MCFHRTSLILFYCLIASTLYSQLNVNPDSVLIVRHRDTLSTIPKNMVNASGLILACNMGVWGFDRYITESPFAYIDFNTIHSNLKTGFEWDNDNFFTNLMTHPVNGGIYFNALRSNGLNFWESIPLTTAGSLMWELCMENQLPSINDFITTSIGGTCLGETTFRITDRFIDDRTTGLERIKREAMIFIISPTRGLNRLLNGETWKHGHTRGNTISISPLTFYTSFGYRAMTNNTLNEKFAITMPSFDLGLYYGTPFDPGNEKPYDFFWFRVGGNISSQQPVIHSVNALGMLYARNIHLKRPTHQLTLGIFQHYNYYQSQGENNNPSLLTYQVSETASVGTGLIYKSSRIKNITFSCSLHLSTMLLGGSQTGHYFIYERNYNMGSGYSSKGSLDLQFGSKARLLLNAENYRLYSWTGNSPKNAGKFNTNVMGDKGNHSNRLLRVNLSYIINKHFLLDAETVYYFFKSVYDYYPTVNQSAAENKVSVGYVF